MKLFWIDIGLSKNLAGMESIPSSIRREYGLTRCIFAPCKSSGMIRKSQKLRCVNPAVPCSLQSNISGMRTTPPGVSCPLFRRKLCMNFQFGGRLCRATRDVANESGAIDPRLQ